MVRYILDASALLALLFLEKGSDRVDEARHDAAMSTVNLAETLTKLAQDGVELEEAMKEINALSIEIVDYDLELAAATASLRLQTRHLGLSLGDRACLALAIRENAVAVTADKSWGKVSFCTVDVIR